MGPPPPRLSCENVYVGTCVWVCGYMRGGVHVCVGSGYVWGGTRVCSDT